MGVMREILIAGSQNRWLGSRVARYRFVQRAVSRFMPGEGAEDALSAARRLQEDSIRTIFTCLGENITDPAEAGEVIEHYLCVLDRIRELCLKSEISIKLTQLGLDLDKELCYANLTRIIERAGAESVVWIDMEASNYVDDTLDLYRRARWAFPNVGVCLQAYLYRTMEDLDSLIPLGPVIRLVKGAYSEPSSVAFPHKKDVDQNFFALTERLFSEEARKAGVRPAIGTHDRKLIRRIQGLAASRSLPRNSFEFQMLYGIQRPEQFRLAKEGWRCAVLISYGKTWFPWFMRRLAERPANVLFVLRNLV